MKLEKIVAVCTANAFRSPSIDACTRGTVRDLGREYIEVMGRGVKANYWRNVVVDLEDIPEKYMHGAFQRAISDPENYSENINRLRGSNVEVAEIARTVLAEERKMYRLIIERFCDEIGLPYPSGYHQQLEQTDLEGAHILVASDKEKAFIDLPEDRMTVLGITDNLGGTYEAKKPVMESIKKAVDEVVPKIIEQYS